MELVPTRTAPHGILGPAIRSTILLCGSVGALAVLYGAILGLSIRFEYHAEFSQRPILLVVALLAAAYVVHMVALVALLRRPSVRHMVLIILFGAAVFRLLLLPSYPIQEVDIYRYLWDGAVTARGINPYRLAPGLIRNAPPRLVSDLDFVACIALKKEPSLNEALSRIHYPMLTSPYPPVSQAVFALADRLVPSRATLYRRMVTLKLVITAFDFGTLCLVIRLLRYVNWHPAWAILYGWSPLVLKEFANTGHLDAIAVFFATLAVANVVKACRNAREHGSLVSLLGGAIALALGVGAKLYPMVLLAPLAVWLSLCFGKRLATAWVLGTLVVAAGCLAPMLLTRPVTDTVPSSPTACLPSPSACTGVTLQPNLEAHGLLAFLQQWEINDLVFLVVVENMRPDPRTVSGKKTEPHWFVVVPSSIRQGLSETLSAYLQMPAARATFIVARAITLIIYLVIVIALLLAPPLPTDTVKWLGVCFYSIAWFWALAPTQNPWYWTWALPLVWASGGRAYLLVSFCVLGYYLRFLILYHPDYVFPFGVKYYGEDVFHYVLAPFQHLSWMLVLALEHIYHCRKKISLPATLQNSAVLIETDLRTH